MKKNIAFFIAVLIAMNPFGAYCQKIKIGMQCPDVTLQHIVNYKTQTAKISDFKGKLLIIDFWATWCGPCVGMIPKTDSLQKTFDGKLVIFPVTNQDEKTVSNFYRKYNEFKHILPFSATLDTALWRLFKPNQFPHYIWINGDGKVIAVTGMEEVTAVHIQSLLSGMSITLPEKKLQLNADYNHFFEMGTPINDSVNSKHMEMVPYENVLYRSVLTKNNGSKYTAGIRFDSTRVLAINSSIRNMYKACVGKFQYEYLFDNMINVENKNTSLVTTDASGSKFLEWAQTNTYCYELRAPKSSPAILAELMTADLNRYFGTLLGIEGVLEKRITKCLVLVRTTKDDKIATKQIGKEDFYQDRFSYKDKGGYILYLIRTLQLDLQTIPTPIVDDTGYEGKIDIELNCNTHDLNAVNTSLEKYGLKFVTKDYAVNKIIIRDIAKKDIN